MLEAMIFDFDGVIVNSFNDQYLWFKHICELTGKPFNYSNIDEFKKDYRSPPYPDMYEFLGFNWDKEKDLIWEEYNKHKSKSELELFDNIGNVIKKLYADGLKLGIASSNIKETINKQLEKHDLSKYFLAISGKEDLPLDSKGDPMIKPYPHCILQVLEKLGVEPDNAFYVGDLETDALAAKYVKHALGKPVQFIGAAYGNAGWDKLKKCKPRFLISNPIDLFCIVSWANKVYRFDNH